jgi:putative ABC transport system permease protein
MLKPLDDYRRNLKLAVRLLWKSPQFALVSILSMAVGIGATTTFFTLADAVLFRPLPFPDGERLVQVWSAMPRRNVPRSSSSMPDYEVWRARSATVEALGAYRGAAYNLSGTDTPERVRAVQATPSLLAVLQTPPAIGHWYSESASEWGAHRVALVSDGFWRRRLGADPNAVGHGITLDGDTYMVMGVMPASFQFPDAATELWVPLSYPPDSPLLTRQSFSLSLIGRLRAGVTPQQAEAELTSLAKVVNPDIAGSISELHESMVGSVRQTLLLLLGTGAFVLLLACANVSSLALVRHVRRQRELTVCAALGAGRGHLLRQLLAESSVLATVGGMLGVGLTALAVQAVRLWAPFGLPRLSEAHVDLRVLGLAVLVSVVASLVVGILPALGGQRVDVREILQETGRGSNRGRRESWSHTVLIGSEVALAVMLLIGTGLMLLSLARLQQADLGFRPQQVVTFQLDLPANRYRESERSVLFIQQLVDRLRAVPGVESAGATSALPISDIRALSYLFSIKGRQVASFSEIPVVGYRQITTDYFRVLGAAVLVGRSFAPTDAQNQPLVAVVNETLAKKFWPDGAALGQVFVLGPPPQMTGAPADPKREVTIVGVIRDLLHEGPDRPPKPEVFVPYAQAGAALARSVRTTARVSGNPADYVGAIRALVHELDPSLPVSDVRSMEERLGEFLMQRRITVQLLGLFSAVALLIAIVGIYGVVSYVVRQRRHELGIRLALGADPAGTIALVTAHNLKAALAGIAVGVVLAYALSAVLQPQLFQVSAVEPIVYAASVVVMFLASFLASYVPVRREVSADPARSLADGGAS